LPTWMEMRRGGLAVAGMPDYICKSLAAATAFDARKVEADRELLRQALQRTAILSNEKYRGIRLTAKPEMLVIQAHNPEQEEAEDQVEVSYSGEEVEIGFNVNYLLDALGAIDTEKVEIGLTDSNSSCLIHSPGSTHTRYVVMPMRL
jgi:DNA polymerase III subunit beta